MRAFAAVVGAVLGVIACGQSAFAQGGDLALRPERLEPLVVGDPDNSFYMEPKEYRLTTGQAYRWPIIVQTDFEYALVAPEFFRDIWVRKVEIGDIEIKAQALHELEFEDVGEAELFFVPIRTGTYELRSRGMEERGMIVTIIVE
jgi:hypothetical protein